MIFQKCNWLGISFCSTSVPQFAAGKKYAQEKFQQRRVSEREDKKRDKSRQIGLKNDKNDPKWEDANCAEIEPGERFDVNFSVLPLSRSLSRGFTACELT